MTIEWVGLLPGRCGKPPPRNFRKEWGVMELNEWKSLGTLRFREREDWILPSVFWPRWMSGRFSIKMMTEIILQTLEYSQGSHLQELIWTEIFFKTNKMRFMCSNEIKLHISRNVLFGLGRMVHIRVAEGFLFNCINN